MVPSFQPNSYVLKGVYRMWNLCIENAFSSPYKYSKYPGTISFTFEICIPQHQCKSFQFRVFSTFRDLFDKIRPRINLSGRIRIPVSNLQSGRITKELPEALLTFF